MIDSEHKRHKNVKKKARENIFSACHVQEALFSECKEKGDKKANEEEGGTDVLVVIALYNYITKEVAGHRGRSWHITQGKNRTHKQKKLREKVTFGKRPQDRRGICSSSFPSHS